ncbi:Endophilin-A2 [Dinochytrium kinnereticum]|nr:Endophilin-A2 [Dinochytrium kinnereticum]
MESLASSMINFGSVLDEESSYGRALLRVGEAHEKIATLQTNLAAAVQDGYVNHLNNITTDMKEYQKVKTKLENRRLDFDAKLNRVHKSKKENTVLEEEIRVAQNKYEESLSDTTDRMIALNSNEDEQLHGLLDFVDAEVEYFKSTLQILVKLQSDISELRDVVNSKPKTGISHRSPSYSTNNYDEEETTQSSHMSRSSSYNTMGGPDRKMSAYGGVKQSPTLPARTSIAPTSGAVKKVKVLYDFDAEGPGELSIRSGDIINVTVEIDEGWWEGELTDGSGAGGMFPSNYVEVIEEHASIRVPPMPSRPSSQVNSIHSNGGGSARGSLSNTAGRTPSVTPPRPSGGGGGGGGRGYGGGGGVMACSTCNCSEFIENAFKPGQCRTCFHK